FHILILASIPIIIAGYAFVTFGLTDMLRDTTIIAISSIVFGVVLYIADTYFQQKKAMGELGFKAGLIIGLSQILALIPGTSRSGITMTAGRALGFSRVDAARFSMLLAIPTILAAATLGIIELAQHGTEQQIQDAIIAGTLSFFTAIAAIHFLMKWLAHASMTIFVVYRVLLGAGLLIYIA
ncbi:MAG: undecaprenyl-diphosphate phosphatase, partial [Sphingomonadales bacterium]|nr:undecaprenyl-diphosphate phosphatase [Sphingomonadales bacterium]